MFSKVNDAEFITGEHTVLKFWNERHIFQKLRAKNAGKQPWSFLDGPITANNPMGVHHAWGRTYKDSFQRYWAMNGRDLRYQNGFDCQGLWVEVEVEKQLGLGAKSAIEEYGIDKFVQECKRRVLKYAAIQTEQSVRLGYWMEWDRPEELRKLASAIGSEAPVTLTTPKGITETAPAEQLVSRLGNPDWGGSYFTFSTENNETIWTFLKKCFQRGKVYRGHDVMPWSGRGGSAYSQMEVADGRKLTTHRALFVRFPLLDDAGQETNENLLIWTTTPWTLTSNVAAMINPELDYVKLQSKKDGLVYYFAKDNLEFQRLAKEFKEGFGRPEWQWPKGTPKLKTLSQIFKESGGYEILDTIKGKALVDRKYRGPFDELERNTTSHKGDWSHREQLTEVVTNEEHDIHFSGRNISRSLQSYLRQISTSYPALVFHSEDPLSKHSLSQITCRLKTYGFSHLSNHIREHANELDDFDSPLPDGQTALLNDLDDFQSNADFHRVIDGGRDFKGSPNVVAGEGTGIVHSAPGCGDVDHQIGLANGLPTIAPLGPDGNFLEGFGPFTGKNAVHPETVQLVIDSLKEKGLLVAEEKYPHIYPFCWRTGDELVFRLVDEWFINMDWRDEIMGVTKQINWLPDSIQGQEREVEWLTNMRDWMISKKRYWGLALPIWVDELTGDFEVIGSLAELKARALDGGEGWNDFQGHTPHKPWIDGVKIRNPKTGNLMTRVEDVGNPWLDAGIVSFSTMGYNTHPDMWKKWYPADLVTECFPGQFRNWFYSLLSMATMMDGTPPFKTLLGHRLVMNEQGQPMHKSDGTAIWFEEAAEQIGVDAMRWMYLQQNPASDLRFGTRHPDEKVTLETVNGPTSTTIDGVPTCKVTSGPADEVRRQVLIPLWNSYAFFVNYARLDEFDPNAAIVPVAERPEIDRWLLSNLQALIQQVRAGFEAFDTPAACAALARFIDDLSNWYIRRNRRRFWRSKDTGDLDKRAAYQTLYETLLTLTKLMAPMTPFLAERMYGNLTSGQPDAPESVHLCDYPTADESLLDASLNRRMSLAQTVVRVAHKLREVADQRVRQPLAELRFATLSSDDLASINSLKDVIADELNVKAVSGFESLGDIVKYTYKPNLKTLGPKYGKLLNAFREELPKLPGNLLESLRRGQTISATVGGEAVTIGPDDVLIGADQAEGWVAGDESGIQVALSTTLTPELVMEGMARDFIRHIQQARKDANLEIQQRITVNYQTSEPIVAEMLKEWSDLISSETLANEITPASGLSGKPVQVGEAEVIITIK